MTTSSHFQAPLFGDPSTSLQEDFPVSPSQPPESEKAEMMNDISFRKCYELFTSVGPASSWLKTYADCLVSRTDLYSPKLPHSWRAKVTRSLRSVFLLVPSGLPIEETDSGFWLTEPTTEPPPPTPRPLLGTPSTMDHRTDVRKPSERSEAANQGGCSNLREQIVGAEMLGTPTASMSERSEEFAEGRLPSPAEAMKLLKTPSTHDPDSEGRQSKGVSGSSGTLAQEMQSGYINNRLPELLNTPNTMDSLPARSPEAMQRQMENNRPGRTQPPTLREQIDLIPTPKHRDYKGGLGQDKERIESDLDKKIESTMLRTPSAAEPGIRTERLQTKDGEPAKLGERAYDSETGALRQVGLTQQLEMGMLRTPCSRDHHPSGGKYSPDNPTENAPQIQLAHQIEAMLPTPSAGFDGGKAGTTPEYFEKRKAQGKQDSLSGEVMLLEMLPTPVANEADKGSPNSGSSDGTPSLSNRIDKLMPTPTSRDYKGQPESRKGQGNPRGALDLEIEETMLPTPHGFSPDGKSNGPTGNELGRSLTRSQEAGLLRTPDAHMERGDRTKENMQSRLDRGMPMNLNDQMGAMGHGLIEQPALELESAENPSETSGESGGSRLRLEPAFVEYMMAYPAGWTSLEIK